MSEQARINALTADFQNKKFGAATELAKFGKEGITFLIKEIDRQGLDNKEARLVAIDALGGSKQGFKFAVPALIGIIQNPNEEEIVHIKAVQALRQMGENASPAVYELTRIVDEQETELAVEAILALCKLQLTTTQSEEVISSLITALTRPEQNENADEYKRKVGSMIKANSAYSLSKFGKLAIPAIADLLSQNKESRINALLALTMIEQDVQGVTEKIIPLLDDTDSRTRLLSAITLVKLKDKKDKQLSDKLLNVLTQALEDDLDENTKTLKIRQAAVHLAISQILIEDSEGVTGKQLNCCLFQCCCYPSCCQEN